MGDWSVRRALVETSRIECFRVTIEIVPGVTADPQVAFGKPVIAGTRVPVVLVLGKLAGGVTVAEVYVVAHPWPVSVRRRDGHDCIRRPAHQLGQTSTRDRPSGKPHAETVSLLRGECRPRPGTSRRSLSGFLPDGLLA